MDIRTRGPQPHRGLTGAAPQRGTPKPTSLAPVGVMPGSKPVPRSRVELTSATRGPIALQSLKPETKATSSSTGFGISTWPGGGITIKKLLVLALLTTGRGGFASALPQGTGPARADLGGDADDGWGDDVGRARGSDFSPVSDNESKAPARALGAVSTLHELVADLRTSGIRKVVVGEIHHQPQNVLTNAEVVKGAASIGHVTLYRESGAHFDNQYEYDDYENGLLQLKDEELDLFLRRDLPTNSRPEPASMASIKDSIDSGNVSIKPMFFWHPLRSDLTDFVFDKSFAVASVGLAHAICRATGQGIRLDCPTGPGYIRGRYLNLPFEEYKQVWDGFARAHSKKRPALLVIPGSALREYRLLIMRATSATFTAINEYMSWNLPVDPLFERAEIHQHYLKQGFAILEMPLADSENVTIVAPRSMLPVLKNFVDKNKLNSSLLYNEPSRTPGDQSAEVSTTPPLQTKTSRVKEL